MDPHQVVWRLTAGVAFGLVGLGLPTGRWSLFRARAPERGHAWSSKRGPIRASGRGRHGISKGRAVTDETLGSIDGTLGEDGAANEEDKQQEDEVLWLSFTVALLRHPRLLIISPLVGMLLFVASARLVPVMYVAESQFLPQISTTVSTVFGFPVPSQGEGVDFYETLLGSRQFLKEISLSEYRFLKAGAEDSTVGNILEIFEIDEPTHEERLLAAARLLRRSIIKVGIDRQTNIMTLETTTSWPELSVQLNRRLLDHTNNFNLERRQSQVRTERIFVEGRMHARAEELKTAEDELERFLDRNRSLESSPQLQFQRGRIQRRVNLAAGVYTTLSQAYEQARIDEVRNTPVVTIVDPPEGSVRAERLATQRGAMGFVLGLGIAITLALSWEFYGRLRKQHVAELQEAEDLLKSAPAALFPRFWIRQKV